MDTVTQGLLGAAFGQALYGKTLGRRALLWGAAGGLIPDLDMSVIPLLGPLAEFRYHRSLTHALWFGPVAGAAMGYVLHRWLARRQARGGADAGPLRAWIGLFVVALLTHPLLDLFTTYGTQLLWPFSNRRFALDAVAILDPLYSMLLVAALVVGRWKRDRPELGAAVAWAALLLSTGYLVYGLQLNGRAEALVRQQLAGEGTTAAGVRSYPTLLQPWLRRIVVRTEGEVRVGFLSLLRPGPVAWKRFAPARHPLVDLLRGTPEGQLFEWFASGETAARLVASDHGAVVEIEDLRYGYGEAPDEGLWGIRASFDPDGRLDGPVARFTRAPRGVARPLALIWRSTFGP